MSMQEFFESVGKHQETQQMNDTENTEQLMRLRTTLLLDGTRVTFELARKRALLKKVYRFLAEGHE